MSEQVTRFLAKCEELAGEYGVSKEHMRDALLDPNDGDTWQAFFGADRVEELLEERVDTAITRAVDYRVNHRQWLKDAERLRPKGHYLTPSVCDAAPAPDGSAQALEAVTKERDAAVARANELSALHEDVKRALDRAEKVVADAEKSSIDARNATLDAREELRVVSSELERRKRELGEQDRVIDALAYLVQRYQAGDRVPALLLESVQIAREKCARAAESR